MDVKKIKKFLKNNTKRFTNNSPFAGLREDEIVEKKQKKQLFVFYRNNLISKVVVARCLERKLTLRDFAQRKVSFPVRTVFISQFVYDYIDYKQLTVILAAINSELGTLSTAIEFYAEDTNLKEYLVKLGFEKVMTKISAFAEVKVIYANYQFLTDDDKAEEATLLTLSNDYISSEQNYIIQTEIKKTLVKYNFANHYSIYNKDNSWSGLALTGYDKFDPYFIEKPSEMSVKWKKENKKILKHLKTCHETELGYAYFPITLSSPIFKFSTVWHFQD